MVHTQKISLPTWMQEKTTRTLLEVCDAQDIPVRFVGGCVRDALLGKQSQDLDLATPVPPETVQEKLSTQNINVVPTGIDHGTVTVIIEGKPFEITTLRKDVETYGRHAKVAFTSDWAEDAARRDFTMNALSMDSDGTVYDYFTGFEDLTAGRVQFVGIPADRIQEDYLRILRLFRFYAYYGKEELGQEALLACQEFAGEIKTLSGERIHAEFFKILLAPNPAPVLELMQKHGVLGAILEVKDLKALATLVELEKSHDLATTAVRRLTSLLAFLDKPENIDAFAQSFKLSNKEKKHLAQLNDKQAVQLITKPFHRGLYFLGPDIFLDHILLMHVAGDFEEGAFEDALQAWKHWQPQTFPLTGQDALELGLEGKAVGATLSQTENWWVDQSFAPSREECLAHLGEQASLA